MTALTLPGTIPGLLRRGSPVICTAGLFAGRSGVVVEASGDGSADVSVNDCRAGNVERYEARELDLDLTDATGRAHAAWWLASWYMLGEPLTARIVGTRSVFRLSTGSEVGGSVGFVGTAGVNMCEFVPALDHLNPDDDTRLPDGSRWVDAEALRLVCLHVAGVAS